ncbi:MAG: YlxR family protein [Candidatus Gastranaerophilales bacterium]|nr:YlxR family protein [Candidatus Gastranaerophilales bacterium]
MIKRKCVGCGEIKDVKELIKITRNSADGKVVVNTGLKIFGRSAYLCYNKKCIESAFKKSRLNKALKSSEDLKGLLDGREY